MGFFYFALMKNILLLLIASPLFCFSQHNHDDENHSHEDHSHKNEISIAAGIVPIPAEDEIAAGIHLHYIKGIGESNKFGIGVGLETILDHHKHYTLSAVFPNYNII